MDSLEQKTVSLLKNQMQIGGFQVKNFALLEEKDLKEILSWRNDLHIRKWMFNQHEITWEEHAGFVNALKKSEDKLYFLVNKDGHDLGVIYLYEIDLCSRRCLWGYYLKPNLINSGGGILLAYLVMLLVFENLHLHCLRCTLLSDNEKSLRIDEFLGFKKEGIRRDFLFNSTENLFRDVLVMSILEDEWALKKKEIGSYIEKVGLTVKNGRAVS